MSRLHCGRLFLWGVKMTEKTAANIGARILETVKPEGKQVYSIKEAAAHMGYHASYVTKMVAENTLPATKNEKNRWEITREDIESFMKNRSVKPRRAKELSKYESDDDDPKTVLTLLEEAHAEIKRLEKEVDSKDNGLADELKRREEEINLLRNQVETAEREAAFYREANDSLKNEITELRKKDAEHHKFMQDLIRDMTSTSKA